MKIPFFAKCCLLFLSLTMLVCGCQRSSRPQGLPALYPCRIIVTQEGEPLADASVQLYAEEESVWPVTGTSDAAGIVQLVTYGQFPGAPLGKYRIVITKTKVVKQGEENEYRSGITKIYSLIDTEHTKKESTKLEITVEKRKNSTKIEVGKPVEILVDTISPDT